VIAPTLEIDPGSPITRGDGVTFWVKGGPEGTTFSNWRYVVCFSHVTARNWNSEPKSPPTKVKGISPAVFRRSALIDADFLWHGETISDGPNKG
jgi:hypothetical protein